MPKLVATTVGDLGRVVTGKTPPTARSECFGDEYPFITPSDIDHGVRASRPGRFLSQLGADLQRTLLLPAQAVCVVCIGATIGKLCMTSRPSFTNQQINSVVVDSARHDPRFVYYMLSTLEGELKSKAGGAATPIINKSAFAAIPVAVPSLTVQRRVGDILSAHDDLIENNAKRIKILEEMARSLYREWFVNFRFPGHEKVKMVSSPLGKMPEGWRVGTVADCASLERMGLNPQQWPEEEFEHFSFPAFDTGRSPAIELGEKILSQKFVFDPGVVLVPKLNPHIPRTWLPRPSGTRRALASTEYLVLRPRAPMTQSILFMMCEGASFVSALAGRADGTSTSHKRIKPDDFMARPQALPDVGTMQRLDAMLRPMLDLVWTLERSATAAGKTRDLLLPRLISGEIALDADDDDGSASRAHGKRSRVSERVTADSTP